MYKNYHSKSKIVATMGPACGNKDTLRKMISEGIDVCRLNFSHGKHEDHQKIIEIIRELNKELNTHVAILADLQGPKLRIGEVENNGVELINGNTLTFTSNECIGTAEKVYMSYKPLPKEVKVGEVILVDDGKLKLEVIETNHKDEVVTKVISGGILSSKKGVNLPNTNISLPSLTEKDIEDANFVLEFDVDWIALSFVRSAKDILKLRDIIDKKEKHTGIISKIEKPEAIEDLDNIIEITDGVMVARGDLGVEIPFEEVPVIQKDIVRKCVTHAKPVIIATQMMESMITNFRPTRAEATDCANAVVEGADALMLSGETSVGKYPVDVIRSMQDVIKATEGKGFGAKYNNKPDLNDIFYLPKAICYNACEMANLTNAKGVVVFTYSGNSAIQVASMRPNSNVFAFSPNPKVMTKLSLVRGLQAFYLREDPLINDAINNVNLILKDAGFVKPGDVMVYVGGIPMMVRGPVNMMKIDVVE